MVMNIIIDMYMQHIQYIVLHYNLSEDSSDLYCRMLLLTIVYSISSYINKWNIAQKIYILNTKLLSRIADYCQNYTLDFKIQLYFNKVSKPINSELPEKYFIKLKLYELTNNLTFLLYSQSFLRKSNLVRFYSAGYFHIHILVLLLHFNP